MSIMSVSWLHSVELDGYSAGIGRLELTRTWLLFSDAHWMPSLSSALLSVGMCTKEYRCARGHQPQGERVSGDHFPVPTAIWNTRLLMILWICCSLSWAQDVCMRFRDDVIIRLPSALDEINSLCMLEIISWEFYVHHSWHRDQSYSCF